MSVQLGAGRSILVLGGHGFLGQHLVRALLDSGYSVTVADRKPAPDLDSLTYEFVQGDLVDSAFATHVFSKADVCIHLAAQLGGVRLFSQNPAILLASNNGIITSTFGAAIQTGLRQMIYVSSSCVFDNAPSAFAKEADLPSIPPPRPGYQFAKLIGEAYCRAFREQHGLSYVIVRPFNVYGPGELPGHIPGMSHVIPDLTLKILAGGPSIDIFGDGQQTRSFTYVTDVIDGILRVLTLPGDLSDDFNLGCPREIAIQELAASLWRICGRSGSPVLTFLPPWRGDVRRRAVDINKARSVLGWEPQIRLEDGLRMYVGWFREQQHLRDDAGT